MSRYKEFDQYEELLKGRLSKKRFTHTMNVAEACYDLAERFGGDKKRCYLAGMLHDIMKEELPERQKQMTAESGFQPDSAEIDTPALRHAVAGAAYVRDQLGIDDEEILAGIRFHTIGCAKDDAAGEDSLPRGHDFRRAQLQGRGQIPARYATATSTGRWRWRLPTTSWKCAESADTFRITRSKPTTTI